MPSWNTSSSGDIFRAQLGILSRLRSQIRLEANTPEAINNFKTLANSAHNKGRGALAERVFSIREQELQARERSLAKTRDQLGHALSAAERRLPQNGHQKKFGVKTHPESSIKTPAEKRLEDSPLFPKFQEAVTNLKKACAELGFDLAKVDMQTLSNSLAQSQSDDSKLTSPEFLNLITKVIDAFIDLATSKDPGSETPEASSLNPKFEKFSKENFRIYVEMQSGIEDLIRNCTSLFDEVLENIEGPYCKKIDELVKLPCQIHPLEAEIAKELKVLEPLLNKTETSFPDRELVVRSKRLIDKGLSNLPKSLAEQTLTIQELKRDIQKLQKAAEEFLGEERLEAGVTKPKEAHRIAASMKDSGDDFAEPIITLLACERLTQISNNASSPDFLLDLAANLISDGSLTGKLRAIKQGLRSVQPIEQRLITKDLRRRESIGKYSQYLAARQMKFTREDRKSALLDYLAEMRYIADSTGLNSSVATLDKLKSYIQAL